MRSDISCERQLTYDSSDAKLQWRCNAYILRRPSFYVPLIGPAIFVSWGLSFPVAIVLLLAATLLPLAITVYRRSRSPRICTTSVDEVGVHDLTPTGNNTYGWKQIQSVETSEGDVFFMGPWGCGVFVPASAFPNRQASADFFRLSRELWDSGRTGRALANPNETARLIEEMNERDESQWIELEKRQAEIEGAKEKRNY
jgi:hypothetical protein